MILSGINQVLARIDAGTSPLIVSGVSGGAIAVPFLPARQFSPPAAAAALTSAIATSPLQVTTVTPGGGTLLFGNTERIDLRAAGGTLTVIGQPLPAVSDLAGNAVESNRDNDETRFTIIMPEIRFDFGDAPDSYGTLLASNGARHTISSERTPRLGQFVDTEEDGAPFPDSDDQPIPISASATGGVFSIDGSVANRIRITAQGATPVGGETLTLTLGDVTTTFELVDPASNPGPGNVPVIFNTGDSPELIANRLALEIRPRLDVTGGGVILSTDPDDGSTLVLDSIDDEDGVSIATFTVDGQPFFVFTQPGTDPADVGPESILGFLNPLDASGTMVAITATGGGLVDAWIDFNGNGVFDEEEQVLRNQPVVDGLNLVRIFTPADAVEGDTWARFRISESGNLAPTGVAVGGEVEDYRVSVLSVPAPTAVDDFYTVREDTLLVIGEGDGPLLENDENLEDQFFPPIVMIVEGPENGTLTITDVLTGTFTYQPNPHFNGPDTFVYDLNGSLATVTINVTPVNDAPQFSGDLDVSSLEDAGLVTVANWAVDVQAGPDEAADELANETDPPQLPLEFTITPVNAAAAGALFATLPTATVDGSTATLSYETKPNQNGEATFIVTLRDQGGTANGGQDTSQSQTFTITVIAVNDPPEFTPGGRVTVLEDSDPFSAVWATEIRPGPITATDELDQTVSFQVVTPPEFEILFATLPAIDDDGFLTFVPADNASGLALIQVTAIDSEGAVSEPVTLEIDIQWVNDPPIAIDDLFISDENTVLVLQSSDLTANDLDPDLEWNPDEFLSVSMPLSQVTPGGALVTFNPNTGETTYDPTEALTLQQLRPGQSFDDTFEYQAIDASGATSDPATVTIRVNGINDPPVARNVTQPLNLGGPTTVRVLDNDFDVDGTINPNSIEIELQPAFGFVTFGADGVITYTPFVQPAREDEFRYTVADDLGARSNEARVFLTTNQPPVAVDDFRSTFADQPININVVANDFDPDGSINPGTVLITALPQNGTATLVGAGIVRYTPAPGFVGTDSFRYTVQDLTGLQSNAALVTVQVLASPGQNPVTPTDVDGDGFVSAIDALLIINKLSRELSPGQTSIPVDPTAPTPPFYDVNGDRSISSFDALLVINALSRQQGGNGEGEGEGESVSLVLAEMTTAETAASYWDEEAVPPLDLPVRKPVNDQAWDGNEWGPVAKELVDSVAIGREKANGLEDDLAAIDEVLALLD